MPQLTPAITQATPSSVVDRRRNELAFYCDKTQAVLDPRVERGDLLEAHAGVVRWVIIEVLRIVVNGFLPWAKTMFETYTSKARATALAKETAKTRAALDGLDGPASAVTKLTNDAAITRSNAWARRPDGFTIIATKPAPFDPAEEMRAVEIRRRLEGLTPTALSKHLFDALPRGDDETITACLNAPGSGTVFHEVRQDEATMRKLGDLYLARSGKKAEVESAEMAVSLASYVLGQARATIDAIAGAPPTDYVTGSGRRVARASERASEATPDFASRLLRIDASGNSVPLRTVDETGNVVPVDEQ